jgi:P4 family phage/plasmid primase-like protien
MNNNMSSSSQYTDLTDFLIKHNAKDKQNTISTHTRIPSQELNIYGGTYFIEKEELPLFYRLYYENVFVKKRKEYLTEKQLENNGPLLVDFDFRYDFDITTRQHNETQIQDIIEQYLEELKNILVFESDKKFPIFIMEKPNINRVIEKQITKDGIHIIFGIQMDHILQQILRERMIKRFSEEVDLGLPLKNSWDNILDEGISKGVTNWQMYGSQKPGNEAYKLSYYITAELDTNDNEWMTVAQDIRNLDLSKDLYLLSAQYDKHHKFDINPNIMEEYNKKLENKTKPKKTSNSKGKINLILQEDEINYELSDITNFDILNKMVDHIICSLKPNEKYIEEIHRYTQILPEKYYQPGSHLLNRKVAFALKHTDERLFLSWVMLRSKATDFDYSTIPNLYHEWKYNFKNKEDGLTKRSIMYWAKQDAFEDYEKVKRGTIDNYIDETIFEAGDWDYAMVLYHMFKDKYVCSSISNKKWYVFRRHRWEKDEGQSLRLAISKDLYQLYSDKQSQLLAEAQGYETSHEIHDKIQRKVKKIAEICVKLKKTNDKNNIMREAMEIFFDKDFIKQMDANPYLMCFTNGVIDFKNKTFRDGYPQDYITKTTGIPYYNFDELIKIDKNREISENIITFMEQLFPKTNLCRYMWDHLASTLVGIKKEQVFNIYRGSGSNGKSLLTELMAQTLGEYKGTVPITLVTEKRNSIGGTSSEVIQLKGVRYAVMQEPSKDAVINEGIMKELTGGDPIQGRALYSDSEIFIPQFSLVVCTNALFEIKSNDDGTWRRLKLVDFMSKFISEDEPHTDDTPFVFLKDKSLKEKLPEWTVIFASMLVKRVFETDGEVVDCEEVLAASNKYRQNQDSITGFINDKIIKVDGGSIGKKILNDTFKEWFQMNYGNRKIPKLLELEEVMNKKFGVPNLKTRKWMGIKIKPDEDEFDKNDLDEIENC